MSEEARQNGLPQTCNLILEMGCDRIFQEQLLPAPVPQKEQ